MTIRSRLLVVAAIPAVLLAATVGLLRSAAPAGTAMLATSLAAVGVVVTVGLALSVARTITSPLHRLGQAAERASHLQSLVEALRRPSGNDQALALTPVGLPPGGEIGTVAAAFDDFQGAAARLAVGQAALLNKTVAEKGTIEVFVNLARRMQGLVDHQIEFLDGLEAEEQDADTLENLFRLDQLATRVRRNAESLLTLAGAASTRSWERPLAMSDVIRAGMAEVEDIGRVDLLMDDNAAMLGNVAADAAHLLSELLENATRWSPPDTRVEVTGSPAAGGYAISIEDNGIGMAVDALAEANHILTGPPLAEATVARSLGLVVAGRLARRLGIVVRLAAATSGGIVAKVLVPPTLMVAADETLGLEEAVAGPPRTLPFALARQEKRARISSQRSRGARPVPGASAQPNAPITEPAESRWMDEPAPRQQESHWLDEPAPAAPTPVEPEWPAAVTEWAPSPSSEAEWTPSEPQWPAAPEPEWQPSEQEWPAASSAADPQVVETEPSAPPELKWPAHVRDEPAAEGHQPAEPEPQWPAAAAEVPDVARMEPAPFQAVEEALPAPVAPVVKEPKPAPVPVAEVRRPEPVVQPAPVPVAEAPVPAPVAEQPAPVPVAEVPVIAPVVPPPPAPPAPPAVSLPQWQPAPPPPPARRPEPAAPPAAQPQRPPTPPVHPAWPASQSPLPTRAPAVPAPAPDEQLPTRAPAAAASPAAEPYQPAPAASAPAPEAPDPDAARPTGPAVRPARFAASSRSLAGAAPQRTTVPSAEAKEDEYRRHLERATAAGLVRRVPKASLPQDTGGGAKRAPKTGGDQPVAERLPDEVRSLLSSYRSGVQRGRADGPDADQRTTTPQEQP